MKDRVESDYLPLAERRILVTGGTGYIGSHVVERLRSRGACVLVLDNFTAPGLKFSEQSTDLSGASRMLRKVDIRHTEVTTDTLTWFNPDLVIHAAGLKSVPESMVSPLAYYDNNVGGTISLLKAMDAAGCDRLIYASSAAVYGAATSWPISEEHPLRGTNAYARSKIMIEQIVADWAVAKNGRSACGLRYFNPIGHRSSVSTCVDGTSLINGILRVAIGRSSEILVHGSDYPTPDGTGLRDFIHIDDLSDAHLAALNFVLHATGHAVFNVGSGQGTTVLQLISMFETACGTRLPYRVHQRRKGDSAASISCLKRIERNLGWRPQRSLEDACLSAWRSVSFLALKGSVPH